MQNPKSLMYQVSFQQHNIIHSYVNMFCNISHLGHSCMLELGFVNLDMFFDADFNYVPLCQTTRDMHILRSIKELAIIIYFKTKQVNVVFFMFKFIFQSIHCFSLLFFSIEAVLCQTTFWLLEWCIRCTVSQ